MKINHLSQQSLPAPPPPLPSQNQMVVRQLQIEIRVTLKDKTVMISPSVFPFFFLYFFLASYYLQMTVSGAKYTIIAKTDLAL